MLFAWSLSGQPSSFDSASALLADEPAEERADRAPSCGTDAEDKARARKRPMTKRAAFKRCAPQAVNIEVIGRDNEGKWASHGAGSILHEDGYILTCEHVTVSGVSHKVTLRDGSEFDYKVLGRAGGSYDTAVLKIETDEPLPTVTLGRSDDVRVGQRAMVIGNAGGRPHTVNYGVVEQVACGGGTQIHIGKANILPGDSGGPVFNLHGEQIAHVHVKITTMQNASRHIRIDHVRDAFAKVFMNEDRYDYAIGIEVDCHADDCPVTSVAADSPAAEAGVRVGDVITQLDSMRIGMGLHYVLALMDRVGADPVTLAIDRDGEALAVEVTPRRQ
ncbi:MAG: PDZ domain-containing protein [Planctomycetota bacterium]|nr:MAG: PDZ domain-containing protein [Planctomycetota bacterium]REK18370.1 MAG: PDZ domain-containing protein [Planctomycetota bacterium]REK40447.1 MAG: PDZ domain-containing protein [Planctomycetota bacterium]